MSPTHCCKRCSTESGKHGKKCERCWHIPDASEWEYNDWLVDGSPSKFALLLPHKRDAFVQAGNDPQTYNTPPSFEQVSRWRTNVPQDTNAPPATDNATIWRLVMPYVLEHGPLWKVRGHWGHCGQSCGCCRSHNPEDGANCSECYDGWVMTTVCKTFKGYAQHYVAPLSTGIANSSLPAAFEEHTPAHMAVFERRVTDAASFNLVNTSNRYYRHLEQQQQQQRQQQRSNTPRNAHPERTLTEKSRIEKIGESDSDMQTQNVSSLTAASAAGNTVLDASSLPAAGGKNTPLIAPRPIMRGAFTFPTQRPKSKAKASPMDYFLTPSTFKSCVGA